MANQATGDGLRQGMHQQKANPKVLTMDTLNPCIKTMQYAVRGPIVARAAEIEKELEKARIIISSEIYNI